MLLYSLLFLWVPLVLFTYFFALPQFQAYRRWRGGAWFRQSNSFFSVWIPDTSPDMTHGDSEIIQAIKASMEQKGWQFEDYRPKPAKLTVIQ